MDHCAFSCGSRSGTARLRGFDERGDALRVGCGPTELKEQALVEFMRSESVSFG